MAVTAIEQTPIERVAQEMNLDINIEDLKALSIANMSDPMKQAALVFMPTILLATIYKALGRATHECDNCGHENEVIDPNGGDFQAQKFLLQTTADFMPTIKTMNMNFGMDVEVPKEVLTATEDIEVFRVVMREIIIKLNPTREQMLSLYDSVDKELKSAKMLPEGDGI